MEEAAEVRTSKFPYAKLSWLLVLVIVVSNFYVLSAPLLPQFQLWLRKNQARAVAGLPYKTHLSDGGSSANAARAGIPQDNRMIIPKIALDQHIFEGKSPKTVNKGIWAKPNGSTPPKGGNTILVGHRFTYDGPASFYSLDKVAVGDAIVVYWQGKEYDYKVTTTKVVPPSAIEIENPTKTNQLTIYTCTPLWSAKNRLVVIAEKNDD